MQGLLRDCGIFTRVCLLGLSFLLSVSGLNVHRFLTHLIKWIRCYALDLPLNLAVSRLPGGKLEQWFPNPDSWSQDLDLVFSMLPKRLIKQIS